jgi:deoxycytidylate deaminase
MEHVGSELAFENSYMETNEDLANSVTEVHLVQALFYCECRPCLLCHYNITVGCQR